MQNHFGEDNKQGDLLAQLVQDMLQLLFFFPKKETKIYNRVLIKILLLVTKYTSFIQGFHQ